MLFLWIAAMCPLFLLLSLTGLLVLNENNRIVTDYVLLALCMENQYTQKYLPHLIEIQVHLEHLEKMECFAFNHGIVPGPKELKKLQTYLLSRQGEDCIHSE